MTGLLGHFPRRYCRFEEGLRPFVVNCICKLHYFKVSAPRSSSSPPRKPAILMPDKAYPRRAHQGIRFPQPDFFGKFCHVAKVGDMGPAVRRTADGKDSISANHTGRIPNGPRQYSRLQFHCKQIHSTALYCLASPPRAFTRASTRHEISWSTGRNLRPVAAQHLHYQYQVLLKQFIRKFDAGKAEVMVRVNLMRFCQSSANLVTSLPAPGVWKFHRFPNPAFSPGQYRILKHCLKFCRIPHLKSLWSIPSRTQSVSVNSMGFSTLRGQQEENPETYA